MFEFNTYNFLEKSLKTIATSLNARLIVLPKLLIIDEQSSNEELTQKLINKNLGTCLNTKQVCDIYISPLQKRLLVDSNKYLNISSGILYPSNPIDIPRDSTLIIFLLLIITTLTLLLMFFLSFRNRTSPVPGMVILENNIDATVNEPITHSPSEQEIEIDTYVHPSDIPDLGEHEEVPEIKPEVFKKSKTSKRSSAYDELSSLQQEINTEVNDYKDLKEAYKKLSFELIKDFFPNINREKVKVTLANFPHANSLLLLKLKDNNFIPIESFNVDEYASKNCIISKNHTLIKNYLNKRKGLLIHNFSETEALPKEIFSDQEYFKIKSLFMFSFSINKKQTCIFNLLNTLNKNRVSPKCSLYPKNLRSKNIIKN